MKTKELKKLMKEWKKRPGEMSLVIKGTNLGDKIRWMTWRDQHEAILPLNNVKGKRPSYEDFIELLSNVSIQYYPDDAIREDGKHLDSEVWKLELTAIKQEPQKYFKSHGGSTAFKPQEETE